MSTDHSGVAIGLSGMTIRALGVAPGGAFVYSALKDAYKLLRYLWGPQMSLEFGCL